MCLRPAEAEAEGRGKAAQCISRGHNLRSYVGSIIEMDGSEPSGPSLVHLQLVNILYI